MGINWFIFIVSSVAFVPILEARLDDCNLIEGLLVPVMTPVRNNADIAYELVPQYAQFLYDKGVNGVIVAATSGEGPSMNESMNKRLLDAWMKAAKPLNMLVISSVGAVPMPVTLEMARYSEEIGVDAICGMPEDFYKPTTVEELVHNMQLISEAAPDTPLIYDDIPRYTGVYVDMEEFFELAKLRIPTFRGVKSNEFQNLLLLKDKVTGPLKVYASIYERPSPYYIAALAFLGFRDFVLVELNFFPVEIIDIINTAIGYYAPSLITYQELAEVMDIVVKKDLSDAQLIAALKAAMPLITGIDVGPPLPPIVPLSNEEVEKIKQGLISLNIRIVNSDTESYDYKK